MTTQIAIPSHEPLIVMTRLYDAPRALVWEVTTDPEHVRQWWGGEGCRNPLCEMDVRPGGLWNHRMVFPNGHALQLAFIFVAVEKPKRLVWQHVDHGQRTEGPPTSQMTATLEEIGDKTRWTLEARFNSLAERDAAVAIGFTRPIEASNESMTAYLALRTGRPPQA